MNSYVGLHSWIWRRNIPQSSLVFLSIFLSSCSSDLSMTVNRLLLCPRWRPLGDVVVSSLHTFFSYRSCATVISWLVFFGGDIRTHFVSTSFIISVNPASLLLSYVSLRTSSTSSVDVFQSNFSYIVSVVNGVDSCPDCPKWSWFRFKRKNSISSSIVITLHKESLSLSTFFGSTHSNSSSSSYSSIVFHDFSICVRLISSADIPFTWWKQKYQ